jgi:hypothetical protein
MTFQDIPIADLTHLHFSFGYVTPETFEIAPMDDLSMDLYTEMAKLKDDNAGLKVIVALGGWTFNDNNTATQPVFHDIVSSASARSTFIANLLDFLQEYGYDGVDFDWGKFADTTTPCAKFCNLCPLPAKAHSYTLASERHNVIQTWDVSRESPKHIASRWILSYFWKPLCISIARSVTNLCTRGGS